MHCVSARVNLKFVIVVECRKNSSLFLAFRVEKPDDCKAVSRTLLIYYWSSILVRCIARAFASGLYRAVGYSESALGGTKLPAWFIIERKQVFLSGLAAGASSTGKGIRTDVNSRPDADAQRPLAPGNVSRVVSRIFKRRRKSHKGSERPHR